MNTKPTNQLTKRIYKIRGMDCDACAKMIELDMEDAGISASCNYANETLEVEISDNLHEDKIREIVNKSGYQIAN